ncbi:hypothetical protein ACE1CD_30440 [Aerosakkonema sp. BLCC-F183]|uniref:hypothetical protein n=1 Tax=Aerosakkonema sp. BLCC-F183 TaxID=3342834 RepID=UPI0035B8455E
MELDRQIQLLIDNAPQDTHTTQAMQAIAPALKLLAQQLRHSQYYILQTFERDWVLTALSNRANPGVEKRVIYAFPTLQDATADRNSIEDPQVLAMPVPVTHILFQMLAMNTVDSTVFFETPGNLSSGTELRREDLQNLIQAHLQQNHTVRRNAPGHIPPDIA